ncbi:MAG: exo-alpha-sialidase [Bacteroidales bacterium]|nr:exo-alpha-sialidase [Bacteroidales bacterium]
MKKLSLIIAIPVICLISLDGPAQTGNQGLPVPGKSSEVDKRIDNMGYWLRMAEKGLVPYNPAVPVRPEEFKGTMIRIRSVPQDSPDIPVTNTGNTTQSENSIFADPTDNAHVLNSNNSTDWNGSTVSGLYGADYLYSNDYGTTWAGSISGAGGSNSGDPAAVIGLNGRRFIGFIYNQGQAISWSDNDINWTRVVVATVPSWWPLNLLDKNHLWIDNSLVSPYAGNLYAGWTRFQLLSADDGQVQLCRSSTNGTSWSSPVNVSSSLPSPNALSQGVNISTGPNGEVYAAWAVYESTSVLDEKAIGFNKSTNGGSFFGTATKIITNIKGIRNTGVNKSMRVNSFPSMTVDISGGPNNGNIYVVWSNVGTPGINTGTNKSVYIIRSSNGGTTWTTPVRVNQGPFQEGKEAFFPWITCDPVTGFLYVIFYDDRNTSSSSCETWVALSEDAGATWEDFRVSDVSFTPSPIPGLAADYFGDYLGISARGGWIYPCWTDNRGGVTKSYVSPFQYPVGFDLDLTVNLEGPFNGIDMSTGLNIAGLIPLSQPYNSSPWFYTGTESVTAMPNADVVDWVLVELRDAPDAVSATPATIIAQQAAFLLKDGSVVTTDGNSFLSFNHSIMNSLFAVVRHRNHLGVMSAVPLIKNGGVYSYDFTTGSGQAYGGNLAHKELAPGVWGMSGADGNADNQINNGDKNDVWTQQAGTGGYNSGDFDMNGEVNNGDKNEIWAPNTGLGGQVPI